MAPPDRLDVFLRPRAASETRVGALLRDRAQRATRFVVDESYIELGEGRPQFSLAWVGQDEASSVDRLRKTGDKVGINGFLPPFFENLLPEGALRELIEREFGNGRKDHFDVLARLGADLPGAVVARATAGFEEIEMAKEPPKAAKPFDGALRFSLAGVQLKFSMKQRQDRLTLPMSGAEVGDVILKVPHEKHPDLLEMEHAAMRMVAQTGRRVAETRLVPASSIEGIPEELLKHGKTCLAVTRFDRAPGGVRVQMEDFSQIVGAIGDQKYTSANEESVWNIVRRFAADTRGEILEAVGRSVCNMLIGNGDAHLKNWSFLLPENGETQLSPVYDVVPTIAFGDQRLALSFRKTKDPTIVALNRFDDSAGFLKLSPSVIRNEIKSTIDKAFEYWPVTLRDLMPRKTAEAIVERINVLPFVEELYPRRRFSVEWGPQRPVAPTAALLADAPEEYAASTPTP